MPGKLKLLDRGLRVSELGMFGHSKQKNFHLILSE
jgi:hypothetical protein